MLVRQQSLKLPASIVYQESEVNQILEKMKARAVVLVRGGAFSGKTTLVKQVALAAEIKDPFYIEFNTEIDFGFALQEIARILNPSKVPESVENSRYEMMDLIVNAFAEDPKILLIIDNLTYVRDCENLLEFFVQNISHGNVLITATNVPAIDLSLATDFVVHQYAGLDENQMRKLLANSGVNFSDGEREELTEAILKKSAGNPFILKNLISPALLSARTFAREDIDQNWSAIQRSFLKKFWKNLSTNVRESLLRGAVIKYFDELAQERFREIPAATLNRLLISDVLTHVNDSIRLSTTARETLLEFFPSEILTTRRQILKELESHKTFTAQKEMLFQSLQLGDLSKARSLSAKVCQRLLELGDLASIIRLTEPIHKELDALSFDLRRYALLNSNQQSLAIQECRERLRSKELQLEERLELMFQLGRSLSFSFEPAEALALLEEYVRKTSNSSPKTIEALIFIAHSKGNLGDPTARSNILEARALMRRNKISDPRIWGNFFTTSGVLHNIKGDYELSLRDHIRARDCYRKARAHGLVSIAENNCLTSRFDLGNFSEVYQDLDHLEAYSERYAERSNVFVIRDVRCQTLTYQGLLAEANCYWDTHFSKILSKKDTDATEIWYLRTKMTILASAGKLIESVQYCRQILTKQTVQNSPVNRNFFSSWSNFLEANLERNPIKIMDAWDRVATPSLYSEFRIFLSMLFLTAGYSSRSLDALNCRSLVSDDLLLPESGPRAPQIQLQILRGISFALFGNRTGAEADLRTSYYKALNAQFPLWQFRSKLWLAILMLSRDDHDSALIELQTAESLVGSFDDVWDLALVEPLKHFCFKQRKETNVSSVTASTPVGRYMAVQLFASDSGNIPPIESSEKNFLDAILSLIKQGFEQSGQLQRIVTHEGLKTLRVSEISTKDYDLVVHETPGEIWLSKERLSLQDKPVAKKIIMCLLANYGNGVSKDRLTKEVWGEDYNPLVHDTRIYTNIRRLRGILSLSKLKNAIQTSDTGYYIPRDVRFAIIRR